MNKLTLRFLKACKKAGYRRIAIGVKDGRIQSCRGWPFDYNGSVFSSPDISDREGWPKIWRIAEKFKVWNGAGNHQQVCIHSNLLDVGTYDLNKLP